MIRIPIQRGLVLALLGDRRGVPAALAPTVPASVVRPPDGATLLLRLARALPWPWLPWPKDSQLPHGAGRRAAHAVPAGTINGPWGPGCWSSTTTTRSSTTSSKSSENWVPTRSSTATTPSTSRASGRRRPTPSSSRRGRDGPRTPASAWQVVGALAGEVPILGVCLGHAGHRAGLRRRGGRRPHPHARQDLVGAPRRGGGLRRPPRPLRGHPLPLLGGRAGHRCPRCSRSPPPPPTG